MGRRKPLPADYTPTVRAVLATYARATEADKIAGRLWYSEAHDIARECPAGVEAGAGMLSCLSPSTLWDDNVTMYRDLLAGLLPYGWQQSGENTAKAQRCQAGEHWSTVIGPRGHKTRNFAALIADPDDPHAVCVDRHAFDIAVGRVTSDAERSRIMGRVATYPRFARVYRAAARVLDTTPATVQATTWTTWRREKGLS